MITVASDGRESTFDKIKETDHGANEYLSEGRGRESEKK